MKPFCNLNTQAEYDGLPVVLGPTVSPTTAQLEAAGYRVLYSEEQPQEGYRAAAWRYEDIDGHMARKVIVPPQINIAEEQAAEEAARIEAERQRQLNKPLALRQAENRFMLMCKWISGAPAPVKLGFDELDTIIKAIPDQLTAAAAAIELLAIDSQGKREGGLTWWDDCVWHSEIES